MANFGAGLGGAASGAATGASIGSIIPGVGTAVGAGVGGLFGGIAGLFGKKKSKKRSSFDSAQKKLYKDQVAALRGQGEFADLYSYDPDKANQVFDQNYSNPAYRNFSENIVPTITGQFRGNNLMKSSYAGDALSKAGRDVQENLNAQRGQYLYNQENNARTSKQNALQNILGNSTFAYDKNQGSGSILDQILNTAGPSAGKWFADYLKSNSDTTPAATPAVP